MGVVFRNVDAEPTDDVRTWPYEALVTVLERGLVADWQPIFAELRRDPWGPVANRIERYLSYTDQQAMAALLRLAMTRARHEREQAERQVVARRVREAVARSGISRVEFASRIGTSPSRLSTYASGKVVPSAALLVRIEQAGCQGDTTE